MMRRAVFPGAVLLVLAGCQPPPGQTLQVAGTDRYLTSPEPFQPYPGVALTVQVRCPYSATWTEPNNIDDIVKDLFKPYSYTEWTEVTATVGEGVQVDEMQAKLEYRDGMTVPVVANLLEDDGTPIPVLAVKDHKPATGQSHTWAFDVGCGDLDRGSVRIASVTAGGSTYPSVTFRINYSDANQAPPR